MAVAFPGGHRIERNCYGRAISPLYAGQVAAAEFSSYQAIVTRGYNYSCPLLGLMLWTATAFAQPRAWFADGYHGGVRGHYPPSFTQFMLDALRSIRTGSSI